jgi:cellobiose-specific phosphotransferase system component IIB
MTDINAQLDKIISEQLKKVHEQIDRVPEGKQKDFLKESIKKFKKERKLDPMKFINEFSKIKGEKVDIDKLKDVIHKI